MSLDYTTTDPVLDAEAAEQVAIEILKLKPTDIIELAIADTKEVVKIPGVQLYGGAWGDRIAGTCMVCLAGAVMLRRACPISDPAKDLGFAWNTDELGYNARRLMKFLDYIRSGNVIGALMELGVHHEELYEEWRGIYNKLDRCSMMSDLFFNYVQEIVTFLKKYNL